MTAIDASTITLSVRSEQSYTQSYVVARALYPEAVLQGACVVRIATDRDPIPDYVILEIRGARFCGLLEHAAEQPTWGHVEYGLTNDSKYWDE